MNKTVCIGYEPTDANNKAGQSGYNSRRTNQSEANSLANHLMQELSAQLGTILGPWKNNGKDWETDINVKDKEGKTITTLKGRCWIED
jgi:hypothetical protein